MSTLWTPDGERPIRREPTPPAPEAPPASPPPASPPPAAADGAGAPGPGIEDPEVAARVAEIAEQMARTPAEILVANHAYGLFELAAVHLSQQPPQLDQARIGIDAMAALVEGMAGRLGEAEQQLIDGVAQLRMAFVQIAQTAGGPEAG